MTKSISDVWVDRVRRKEKLTPTPKGVVARMLWKSDFINGRVCDGEGGTGLNEA